MRNNRRGGLGQTLGAFTLGATVGSVVALLWAPASGRAMRRRIGTKLQQSRRLLARRARLLREVAVEKVGDTRDWLKERAARGNGHRAMQHRAAHSS